MRLSENLNSIVGIFRVGGWQKYEIKNHLKIFNIACVKKAQNSAFQHLRARLMNKNEQDFFKNYTSEYQDEGSQVTGNKGRSQFSPFGGG